MLLKVKKLLATDLVKVSSLTAVSTLVRMMTGMVSIKVVAGELHPKGVALLGQLASFSLILCSIATGGIKNGMTKYIAQYGNSKRIYTIFLSTGFWITFGLSITCGLVLIFGANYFSIKTLKDAQYTPVFYVFGSTIILYALNELLLSVINGFREFKKFVTINITGSIVGLIFTVVLALNFGIFGALISLVTYQSVVLMVTLVLVSKSSRFTWKMFFGKFSKSAALRLANYSKMAIVSLIVLPLAQMIVRNYLIVHETADNAGLWESMNRISNIYLTVITTSLSVYYLPKLSTLKTNSQIRAEVMSVYKLLIPFLLVISLLMIAFRYYIVMILFADGFQGVQQFFPIQLLGDILKMSTWVLGYILVAKAMTKTYIIVEILSCALFVVLSMVFVNMFGAIGATIGYAAAFLCQLLIMVLIFRKLLFSHE
ncbi:MAG: O-antigen translocase [Bacteroidetes bacterium]|jgi:O-antigen/teichoic acid export membrane protein|nr:MAG: O-antigen translocase [Bacteroidota bacterium]